MTRHTFLSALACLSLALAPVPALATVDESHDYTMEAATPFVEQGFIVREDYWNGEVKSGQKLMISHQLFKGNEYAFWLGSVNDDVELDLKVYDEKGNAIQLDTKPGNHALSIRVNPQKTGTYKIVFSLKSKKEAAVMWALAYGYR
ncbi:MAG: hypothetical protein JNN17_20685 [Verrucomicrobiaceae bacterium]|nr:hypothetical protein [Verrucomicrobiaceae bacterium]